MVSQFINGGRKTGIISGCRPNHVFEYTSEGKLQRTYIGDINFEGEDLRPGEERIATVRLLLVKELEQYLTEGRKWWLIDIEYILNKIKKINYE